MPFEPTNFSKKFPWNPDNLEEMRKGYEFFVKQYDRLQEFMFGSQAWNPEELPTKLADFVEILRKERYNEDTCEMLEEVIRSLRYLEYHRIQQDGDREQTSHRIGQLRAVIKKYEEPLHEKEPHLGWGEGCPRCLPWPG
jgi:hypothetical protein